jgi:hypothetical protein
VFWLNFHEVELHVEADRLDTIHIQPSTGSISLLKHNEGSPGNFLAFIKEKPPTREPVDQVELELFSRRTAAKAIYIAREIIPKDRKLGKTVLFYLWRRTATHPDERQARTSRE